MRTGRVAFTPVFQISFGRMVFNPKLQLQDRSYTPIKVPVSKNCSHAELLRKGVTRVWKDVSEEEGEFYLSDGSGHKITDDDFTVSKNGREGESVPWTLGNYLQASAIRHPSRTRMYCVFVRKGMLTCMQKIIVSELPYDSTSEDSSSEEGTGVWPTIFNVTHLVQMLLSPQLRTQL